MSDERQESDGAFGTDDRDANQPEQSVRVRGSDVPIADFMRETAQIEQSGAFMSGEDARFEEERGPQESAKRYHADPHPAIEPIMQFFAYEQLRPEQQEISRPFGMLANMIIELLPRNPERTVALRKLLESKDAAVRASLAK